MTRVPMASWFSYGRFSVGEEGVFEGENHTQIKINYPPCIRLQLCGQVCLIKNTCWKSSKFLYFVFNCIKDGTSLLRERLP